MTGFLRLARFGFLTLTLTLAGLQQPGCAPSGPRPVLFPVTPVSIHALDKGCMERLYDTDHDGRPDCSERLNAAGIVDALRYDDNHDGCLDDQDKPVVLADIPQAERRDLVIILDSIPYSMVESLWLEGRFRLFYHPTRVISPFPVMTDLAISDFLGRLPCPGVESAYFDGQVLRDGYAGYAEKKNVPWMDYVDWHLEPVTHASVYLGPRAWYAHELREIHDAFRKSNKERMITYVVGTSAMGARIGRNGHQAALIELDRLCQQLMFETRGRVRMSMLSDHGHHLGASRRIPLSDLLAEFGYRVGTRLERPGDVVVPEFGMVTCAVIHTHERQEVARDVLGIEGMELTAYRDPADRVIVLSRTGRAAITRSAAGLSYQPDFGDPLELMPILAALRQQGKLSPDGFVDDSQLISEMVSCTYPDVLHRLWRAFHGLVQHTPDVLVSTDDGYHCGSAFMSTVAHLTAAHGNLRRWSSTGFSMTMAGNLPKAVRMENLRQALIQDGVRLEGLRPVE
jgi:hypothetical protein